MPDDTAAETPQESLAFQAGARILSEPPERWHPSACPFEPGTPEREEWLRGFRHALGGDNTPDPASLVQQIDDELNTTENIR